MSVWINTLVAVALVSAVPLVVTMVLAANPSLVRRMLPDLLAFGVGVLVASSLLHLIPEALVVHSAPRVLLLVAAGFAGFAGVEWLLKAHDHSHVHGLAMGTPGHDAPPPMEHSHEAVHGVAHGTAPRDAGHGNHGHAHHKTLLPIAFGADVLHNFLDGILIAATFLVRPELGLLTAVAIGLHELPREVSTFGLFVHGGLTPRRAVLFNALTALVAIGGAVVMLLLGREAEQLAAAILPVTAGSMLYIAFTVGRAVLPPVGGVFSVRRLSWGAAGFVGLGVVLG